MKRLMHHKIGATHAIVSASLAMVLSLLLPAFVAGQDDSDAFGFGQSGDLFGGAGGINFGGLSDPQSEPATWSAKYFASGQRGRIEIEATGGRSWHIYSTTQPPGGPLPTEFSIKSPKSVSIADKFTPDEPPTKSVSDIYPGITIEEHDGTVVWSAPIKVAAGFKGDIKVSVNALVCQNGGSCMPANETLTATFAGLLADAKPATKNVAAKSNNAKTPAERATELLADSAAKPTTFRDDDYEVTWTVGVSSSIAAGGQGLLVFRAKPESDFHVYKGVVDDEESSTNFVVTKKSGLLVGGPQTDQPIISKNLFPSVPGVPDTPPVKYHKGQVTWSLPVQVPQGVEPGEYEVRGFVCYQACTDSSCLQPMAVEFVATVMVTDTNDPTIQPIEINPAKFVTAIDAAAETDWVDDIKLIKEAKADPTETVAQESQQPEAVIATPDSNETEPTGDTADTGLIADAPVAATGPDDESQRASLPFILLMALGGGLILNLMPCVLPVIGLKIMSFVQQAGEDRARIFLLNFAYVAGILTVFAGLTTLAIFFSFGWGQQFAYFSVRLSLTVIIFALALSYLGLWELPTPGIATGQSSNELQQKEGLTGAFFTGAFATILATPCSGPLLGVALGYTIYLNAIETTAVIMTVGLGMSLPYIFLGLFPSAIGLLPKPGNWMVTLKEFLAFLFLGTVAYFFNQFSDGQKLPVFVTLIGVWFGCWVIGKVPPWETLQKRLAGWTVGVASAAAIGWLGFAYLERNPNPTPDASGVEYIVDDHIRWEKYNEERLQEHLAAGKTVMLDFTAAWCPNCIVNTHMALDTEPTGKLLKDLDGIAMLADMTNQPDYIVDKLQNDLGSKSIPMLAIYPGSSPKVPILLRDLVSQSMVLEALKKAGPSIDPSSVPNDRNSIQSFTSASTKSLNQQNH